MLRGVRRILFREGLENMVSAIARAYNGGLGAEPPAGSWGRAPGGGSGGRSPLKLKAFCCETSEVANFWEKSNHTFGFAGCQGLFQTDYLESVK